MRYNKETFIIGFALFSMFFGAGNLLLPPMLGYNSGDNWLIVAFGFIITAVIIPLAGIMAHARLQGTMYDFAKKISPTFSIIYCVLVYLISVCIPSPRTAAATFEIVIQPHISGVNAFWHSIFYFGLVLVFALNRSKILSLLGKYLTPIILTILILVIGIGLLSSKEITFTGHALNFFDGLIEGYQTFDAIGAVVIGGVLIISINIRGKHDFNFKKELLIKSGLIAGVGLFMVYIGMIAVGAYFRSQMNVDHTLSNDLQRAQLLNTISFSALGTIGSTFLSVLIGLACFTTAVGIVTGTSDYVSSMFRKSNMVYKITAISACFVGILFGQLNFNTILTIGLPVLFVIYPVTISLIFLNLLPKKLTTPIIFRITIITTIIFSIPDCLTFIADTSFGFGASVVKFRDFMPFGKEHFGWVFPTLFSLVIAILFFRDKTRAN